MPSHTPSFRLRPLILLGLTALLAACNGAGGESRTSVADLDRAFDEWVKALDAQTEASGGLTGIDFQGAQAAFQSLNSQIDQMTRMSHLEGYLQEASESIERFDFNAEAPLSGMLDVTRDFVALTAEFDARLSELADLASASPEALSADSDEAWAKATSARAAKVEALVDAIHELDSSEIHLVQPIVIAGLPPEVSATRNPARYTGEKGDGDSADEQASTGSDALDSERGLRTQEQMEAANVRLDALAQGPFQNPGDLQHALEKARDRLIALTSQMSLENVRTVALQAPLQAKMFQFGLARARAKLDSIQAKRDALQAAWDGWAPSPVTIENRWFGSKWDGLLDGVVVPAQPLSTRQAAGKDWEFAVQRAQQVALTVRMQKLELSPREAWATSVSRRLETLDRAIEETQEEIRVAEARAKLVQEESRAVDFRAALIAQRRHKVLSQAVAKLR